MAEPDDDGLPSFTKWPIFPFEGDLKVRAIQPPSETERIRSGEPGGPPCHSCAQTDEDCVWVNERWRVRAGIYPTGVPTQVFLESRAHVDLDGLDDEMAAELGLMIVRLDRAIQAIGGIGRVHVNRWGDGAEHLHLWFYARPLGNWQMLGSFLPLWASIYPPTPEDVWRVNLAAVAAELARRDGRAIATIDAP